MNPALRFRLAGPEDLEVLATTRVMVLRAANQLPDNADLSAVEAASRAYYRRALVEEMHTAVLVFDGDRVVGTGGVSYYEVMPTVHNPDGRCAYIMNMYTHPDYRRQGIALHTLDLLVRDARVRGVRHIGLEATAAGRPLYEKYGFMAAGSEMLLPEGNTDDGE